jgi:ADP-heptose:LPS heptosyltransferase
MPEPLMTILRSKLSDHTVTISIGDTPVEVTFENHRALVEDHVADTMIARSDFYSIFRRAFKEPVKTALIIRFMGLGDILLTTPLVRYLCQQHGWVIDYITSKNGKPLLESNLNIRQVYGMNETDLTKEMYTAARHKYDAVLDLRFWVEKSEMGLGSKANRAAGFFSAVDITPESVPPSAWGLDYYVTREEREWARDFIGRGHKLTCSFVWNSTSQNKDWTLKQKTEVIQELMSSGFKVFIIGGEPVPYQLKGVRNVAAKLSLRETAAIIAETGVTISPDTGLFHVSQALGRPTLAYIGSFPVEMRASTRKNLSVINKVKCCEIAPCHDFFCKFVDTDKENLCLSMEPGAVVMEAIRIHSRESTPAKELAVA